MPEYDLPSEDTPAEPVKSVARELPPITEDDLKAFAIRFDPSRFEHAFDLEKGSASYTLFRYYSDAVQPYLEDHGVPDKIQHAVYRIILAHAYKYAKSIRHPQARVGAPGQAFTFPLVYAFDGLLANMIDAVKSGELGVADVPSQYSFSGRSLRNLVLSSLPRLLYRGSGAMKHPQWDSWQEAKNPEWASEGYKLHETLQRIVEDDTTTAEIDARIDNETDLESFDTEVSTGDPVQDLTERVEALEQLMLTLLND